MKNKLPLSQSEIVFIEWIDSMRTEGWNKPEKDDALTIHSVGLLVGQDSKKVTISTSRCESGNYVDQLTIPKCSIVKMHGGKFQKP